MLAACGGGGGDPGVSPFPSSGGSSGGGSSIPASSQSAGRLVNSSVSGALPEHWVASTCTTERQRSWVRSIVHEKHLFYRQVPNLNPASYTGTPQNLFYELTRFGIPNNRDRFSFVIPQSTASATFEQGQGVGIGAAYVYDAQGRLRVAYVEPGSPAAGQLDRGAQIVSINGAVVGNSLTSAQISALYPTAASGTIALQVRDTPAGATRSITLTNTTYTIAPVNLAQVLPGNVGYLHYTDFTTPSGQIQLADTFATFQAAGIADLIIDLRYNGGGYLAIAAQLGHMVAGSRGANRTFERLVYSDKRARENVSVPFYNQHFNLPGYTNPRAGQTLPSLDLSRVFVLTTGDSCSASESFINAMKGVDVPVIQIGGTTCGKPYGFTQYPNCTYAYFPIEFEGRNDRNQSFPSTGITPTCAVPDDLDAPLGLPGEALLDAALSYRATGQCPALATGVTAQSRMPLPGVTVGSPQPDSHRRIKLVTP
jgi:C-terminal processing protease CtpA/Prc